MKDVIIADIRTHALLGWVSGHFIPLAKNYVEIFKDACDVKVAGGPAYLQSFKKEIMVSLPYNVNGTSLRDKLHTFVNCWVLFRKGCGKSIILQQSSVATAYLALVMLYHRRSRIFIIQYSKTGIDSQLKRLLYGLAKKNIDGIICPNDEVGKAYGRPYIVVPDYIYTGDLNISTIPFSDKIYDFCFVGRLSPEKGVVEAIKFLLDKPYKILIAGKPQTEELKNEILHVCDGASNVELHLGYLEEEDYYCYIHRSRYSVLNYTSEYSVRSSGVVYDMLFNGTPVIGRRCSALNFIDEQTLGVIYDNLGDVNPIKLMNVNYYQELQQNIVEYRKSHLHYKEKLQKFILG